MKKLSVRDLMRIENNNKKYLSPYTNKKNRMAVVKLCIIGDILLDLPQYNYINDIETKYTDDLEVIKGYSDVECFAVFLKVTMEFLFVNPELRNTTFLSDCINSSIKVLKYLTLQQKMDDSVLLNFIRYLTLENNMDTQFSKRGRKYIDSIPKTNHTYNLTGKDINVFNRTLDRALKDIIELELKYHSLTL